MINYRFTKSKQMKFKNTITRVTLWGLSAIFSLGLAWALIIGQGYIL